MLEQMGIAAKQASYKLAQLSSREKNRVLEKIADAPKILPYSSLLALSLRMILGTNSCGTWQSGQVARTPLRLL